MEPSLKRARRNKQIEESKAPGGIDPLLNRPIKCEYAPTTHPATAPINYTPPLELTSFNASDYNEPKLINAILRQDYVQARKVLNGVVSPKWPGSADPIPEAAFSQEGCLRLPLHLLFLTKSAALSSDFVSQLIKAYPPAAQTRSVDGDLPFHSWAHLTVYDSALKPVTVNTLQQDNDYGNHLEMAQVLIKAYPWALRTPCADGETWLNRILERRPSFQLVKHLISEYNYLTNNNNNIINNNQYNDFGLLQSNIAAIKDQQGCLPIHIALENYASPEVVEYLVYCYPESLTVPRTIRKSFSSNNRTGSDGYYPLHIAALYKCHQATFQLLLNRHPQLVFAPDARNDTPMHLLFAHDKDVFNYSLVQLWLHPTTTSTNDHPMRIPPSNGILSKFQMLKQMIQAYSHYLQQTTIITQQQAMSKTSYLISTKLNSSNQSILDLAVACEQSIISNGPPEAISAIQQARAYLTSITQQYSLSFLPPLQISSINPQDYHPPQLIPALQQQDYNRALRYISQLVSPKNTADLKPIKEAAFVHQGLCLPLHVLLYTRSCQLTLDLVQKIVSAYPDAARTLSVQGELPLHIACQPTALILDPHHTEIRTPFQVSAGSVEDLIIRFLVQVYPWALRVPCEYGTDTWLHRLLEHRPSPALVKDLLAKFHELHVPQDHEDYIQTNIVECKDDQGRIPLHVALEFYAPEEIVEFLVQSFPDSLTVPRMINSDTTTDTHTQQSSSNPLVGNDGYYPLHMAALYKCYSKCRSLLLDRQPQLVFTGDNFNDTPLHFIFAHETIELRELWNDTYSADRIVFTNAAKVTPPSGLISKLHLLKSMIEEYHEYLQRIRGYSNKRASKKIAILLREKRNNQQKSVLDVAKDCYTAILTNGPSNAINSIAQAFEFVNSLPE